MNFYFSGLVLTRSAKAVGLVKKLASRCFSKLDWRFNIISGCDTAALHGLHSREFDSCDGAHCQKCCKSERGADQTHSKCPNLPCHPVTCLNFNACVTGINGTTLNDLAFSPSVTPLYLTILCSCRPLKVNTRLRSRWGSLPSHSSNLQWWKSLQSKSPSERTQCFLAPCADLYSFNLNFLTWPEGSAR